MIELIFIYSLAIKTCQVVIEKGYKAPGYQCMLAGFWFVGEFLAASQVVDGRMYPRLC